MLRAAMNRTAQRLGSPPAYVTIKVIDIVSRREEKVLTGDIERFMVEGAINYISFSYPKSYPAAKPCPERVVFKGEGWRAVYLEKGMKLTGHPPAEIGDLLQRLAQEHILNLQNLLRFLCEHSRKVRTEVDGFDASSAIVGYVQLSEMSAERTNLQIAVNEGFELDFKWEVVKVFRRSGALSP